MAFGRREVTQALTGGAECPHTWKCCLYRRGLDTSEDYEIEWRRTIAKHKPRSSIVFKMGPHRHHCHSFGYSHTMYLSICPPVHPSIFRLTSQTHSVPNQYAKILYLGIESNRLRSHTNTMALPITINSPVTGGMFI
jgi:hypothetical protein